MHISPEVLEQLAQAGLVEPGSTFGVPHPMPAPARRRQSFRPSGLGDAHRIDLTKAPFWAVDETGPEEIDDAIRAYHTRLGGFTLEIAIADAGQLSDRADLLAHAISHRYSTYNKHRRGPHARHRIFPDNVLSELELNSDRKRRALVVRQQFDGDMQPKTDAEVLPAWVRTRRLTPASLGRAILNHDSALTHLGVAAQELGIVTHASSRDASGIGRRTVARFMQIANQGIGSWSITHDVPVLHRAFTRQHSAYAHLTPEKAPHEGIVTGQQVPYAQGTSPLRRANDTVTMLNIASFLHDEAAELPFGRDKLQQIADHLSPRQLSLPAQPPEAH